MSTDLATRAIPAPPTHYLRDDLRRLRALSKAEALLLARNKTALVNALLMPLILVGLFAALTINGNVALTVVTMVACAGLNFVLYYTLVTTLVARRQELVLKRLRTGESPAWVILLAAAVPTLVLFLAQLALAFVAAIAMLDLARPANLGLAIVLVVLAVVLGAGVWILIAVASSAFTKTVESAQITTLPMVIVPLLFSGVSLPLSALPEPLERVAHLLPLTPVVDLFALALTGRGLDGAVAASTLSASVLPLAVLVGWLVVGLLVCRSRFRWEPRR